MKGALDEYRRDMKSAKEPKFIHIFWPELGMSPNQLCRNG